MDIVGNQMFPIDMAQNMKKYTLYIPDLGGFRAAEDSHIWHTNSTARHHVQQGYCATAYYAVQNQIATEWLPRLKTN